MATKAFDVIIRRIATGCDFRIRLFAKDWETAAERATERARFLGKGTAAGTAVFRVMSCELIDDQSRPLDFA